MTTLGYPASRWGFTQRFWLLTCARAALSSLRPACPKQTPKPDADRPKAKLPTGKTVSTRWRTVQNRQLYPMRPCAPVTHRKAILTAQDFRNTVTQVVERILDGEIFQANIAQRFHGRLDPTDTGFGYYQRLRRFSPAPFSAFAVYDGWSLASASPERFLHCAHGILESRPIKGTRPRGTTHAQDNEIAADLLASDKDRAENTMIVDLLRNDMAKSCRDGSIEVPQLCALEQFSNVHHLVSTIRGTLRADTSPLEALRDCFPGGSITGAPKIQAMGVIAELEPHARGPYCGPWAISVLTGRWTRIF